MKKSKILDFKEEYPEKEFPWYEILNEPSSLALKNGLLLKLGIQDLDPLDLVVKKMNFYGLMSKDQEKFKLKILFSNDNLEFPKFAFLYWYEADEIVRLRFWDLNEYLLSLWDFGENIFIFFEDNDKLFFFFDDDQIYYL